MWEVYFVTALRLLGVRLPHEDGVEETRQQLAILRCHPKQALRSVLEVVHTRVRVAVRVQEPEVVHKLVLEVARILGPAQVQVQGAVRVQEPEPRSGQVLQRGQRVPLLQAWVVQRQQMEEV